ncbi:MAG: acetate--CoA ligase family protein, partial [Bdellovibrionales bacterium]|nr:acetate--CoA ligase family protein [Bdellovibrionales bacterium]
MNLHEYQAKKLLKSYGAPVLRGFLAYTPREAQKAADSLGGGVCVVKAQIHAGGRGKGGGVKLAKSPAEALEVAEQILGMNLVSPQTGPEGRLVRKVWVEEGANIQQEFYLSFIMNREHGCVSIIASREGGMEIEEVAAEAPEKVLTVDIAPESGLQPFHCRNVGFFLGLEKEQVGKLERVLQSLYDA